MTLEDNETIEGKDLAVHDGAHAKESIPATPVSVSSSSPILEEALRTNYAPAGKEIESPVPATTLEQQPSVTLKSDEGNASSSPVTTPLEVSSPFTAPVASPKVIVAAATATTGPPPSPQTGLETAAATSVAVGAAATATTATPVFVRESKRASVRGTKY